MAGSKAASPVGPRTVLVPRSRSPRTTNKAPKEPVPEPTGPPPPPVRYTRTTVPVPYRIEEGRGSPLERALANEVDS